MVVAINLQIITRVIMEVFHFNGLMYFVDQLSPKVMIITLERNKAVFISLNTLRPEQNGRYFPNIIFKCTFLNEINFILIRLQRSLLFRVYLSINQCWFRWWLGAEQATSHYLSWYWQSFMIPCSITRVPCGVTRPQWVNSRCAKFLVETHVFIISIIPPYRYDTGSWNPFLWKKRTYLFYIVNIVDADDLMTQGARASATLILT